MRATSNWVHKTLLIRKLWCDRAHILQPWESDSVRFERVTDLSITFAGECMRHSHNVCGISLDLKRNIDLWQRKSSLYSRYVQRF